MNRDPQDIAREIAADLRAGNTTSAALKYHGCEPELAARVGLALAWHVARHGRPSAAQLSIMRLEFDALAHKAVRA